MATTRKQCHKKRSQLKSIRIIKKAEIINQPKNHHWNDKPFEFLPNKRSETVRPFQIQALIGKNITSNQGNRLNSESRNQPAKPLIHRGQLVIICSPSPCCYFSKRVEYNQQKDNRWSDDGDFVKEFFGRGCW